MSQDTKVKTSKYIKLVKLFHNYDVNYLEHNINRWLLKNTNVEVIDIKISGNDSNSVGLVIYKKYINDKK